MNRKLQICTDAAFPMPASLPSSHHKSSKWPAAAAGQTPGPTLIATINMYRQMCKMWAPEDGNPEQTEGLYAEVVFLKNLPIVAQENTSIPHRAWDLKTIVHVAPAAICAG